LGVAITVVVILVVLEYFFDPDSASADQA
jgi:hypothetical protein